MHKTCVKVEVFRKIFTFPVQLWRLTYIVTSFVKQLLETQLTYSPWLIILKKTKGCFCCVKKICRDSPWKFIVDFAKTGENYLDLNANLTVAISVPVKRSDVNTLLELSKFTERHIWYKTEDDNTGLQRKIPKNKF